MLASPPGSAGAARAACVPGVLDDEGVVVVLARQGAGDRAPVEEERRRRADAHPRRGLDVLADAGPGGRVAEAGRERRDVEPELARVAEQALPLEVLVVVEEHVVVF